MKNTVFSFSLVVALAVCAASANAGLILTGIIDGPRSGGLPKAIELYATTAIADMADYAIQVSANGADGGITAPEYTFPTGPVAAGSYIWLASEEPGFTAYFGYAPTYTNGIMNINGDDAVVLFGSVLTTPVAIDVYGDPSVDGTGTAWEHLDSYAYRLDDTGPDGSSWVAANWTVAPIDTLDVQGSTGVNGGAGITVPFGTYTAIPEPATLALAGFALIGAAAVRRRS